MLDPLPALGHRALDGGTRIDTQHHGPGRHEALLPEGDAALGTGGAVVGDQHHRVNSAGEGGIPFRPLRIGKRRAARRHACLEPAIGRRLGRAHAQRRIAGGAQHEAHDPAARDALRLVGLGGVELLQGRGHRLAELADHRLDLLARQLREVQEQMPRIVAPMVLEDVGLEVLEHGPGRGVCAVAPARRSDGRAGDRPRRRWPSQHPPLLERRLRRTRAARSGILHKRIS